MRILTCFVIIVGIIWFIMSDFNTSKLIDFINKTNKNTVSYYQKQRNTDNNLNHNQTLSSGKKLDAKHSSKTYPDNSSNKTLSSKNKIDYENKQDQSNGQNLMEMKIKSKEYLDKNKKENSFKDIPESLRSKLNKQQKGQKLKKEQERQIWKNLNEATENIKKSCWNNLQADKPSQTKSSSTKPYITNKIKKN